MSKLRQPSVIKELQKSATQALNLQEINRGKLEIDDNEYVLYSERKYDRPHSPISNNLEPFNKTPRSTSNITSPKSVSGNS